MTRAELEAMPAPSIEQQIRELKEAGWIHIRGRLWKAPVLKAQPAAPQSELRVTHELPACAAIKFERNGVDIIFAGRRHGDCLLAGKAVGLSKPNYDNQGFMTTLGRFITRREARILMDKAKIPSAAEGGFRGDILFSEDLY